jgi:Na+-transporting methylmalonyl-CoA/oxaloacetate decarboxylase gamma subunit
MYDEPPLKSQPRSMFSTWIGVVLLFAFFALLALVVIGASPRGNTYEEKRAKARAEKLQAAREETTKALTTYAWVDKAKGVVRIPIDHAMKLTVAELAQKIPVPANPIATPEVNPPAQGAAPATPASSPTASASAASKAPAAAPSSPSPAVKASVPASVAPSSPSATPLPVRGKTP